MKRTRLIEKLRYVKEVLKTPYHFFHYTDSNMIKVIFENKSGKHYSFSSYTMFTAITEAENYVKTEINAGALKDVKENEN